ECFAASAFHAATAASLPLVARDESFAAAKAGVANATMENPTRRAIFVIFMIFSVCCPKRFGQQNIWMATCPTSIRLRQADATIGVRARRRGIVGFRRALAPRPRFP